MGKLSQKNAKTSTVAINNISTSPASKVKRTRRTVPRDSPPQRSSIYRGVTRHRWTGRYEAHLWDKNCWNESQNKKGRQVYLGAYDDEEAAAHSYDLAALKYWGEETILNFPFSTYVKEFMVMQGQSREEYIGSLRRKSSGFSRGASKYRGVARHHHNGRWEARIGRVFGNKYLYLGTYATQEEAATAYDMAAIEYRGLNAVTNFDLSRYIKWLRPDNIHNTPNLSANPNPNPGTNFTTPSLIYEDEQLKPTVHYHNQDSLSPTNNTTAQPTSALGLLLQSSKFKEMMEMTTAVECPATSGESEIASQHISSFPDDIRTYFESDQDFGVYGGGNEAIFGDLNSFMFD